jgi:hypothetical protein
LIIANHPNFRSVLACDENLFQFNLDKFHWAIPYVLDAPLLERQGGEVMILQNQWLIRLAGSLFGYGASGDHKSCARSGLPDWGSALTRIKLEPPRANTLVVESDLIFCGPT